MTRCLSALWLVVAAVPAPVAAQAMPSATSTAAPAPGAADQLAAQMRLLAANSNDLAALLTAGELSVKLDDLGAAASFFARVDRIDPHNGRAKAGEAAILVHAERPGEALRYFAQAESYGAQPAAFAAERGLAYDLLGEQERAQRDYRLALRAAPDEETRRRYALSLAISGKRELSEQELRPLLRASDRGAWRARAFALALGGDVAEAERIATTMMPPGTAAGLAPFLQRLPTLGPVDRAFAVHFGEVRSTPERVADARKAPPLAALGPDPYAPRVAVAAVVPDKKKRPDKKRGKPEPVQVAVAAPAPEPLPQAPAYRPGAGAPPVLATRGAAPAAWPTTVRPDTPPTRVAARAAEAMPPTPVPARSLAGTTTLSTPGAQIAAVTPRRPAPVATRAPGSPPPETNVTVTTATAPKAVATVAPRAPAPPPSPPEMKIVVATAAPLTIPVVPTPAPVATSPASSPPETTVAAVTTLPPTPGAPSNDRPAPTSEPVTATQAAIEPAAIPTAVPEPLAAASPPPTSEIPLTTATPIRTAPPRRDDGTLSRIVAGLPIPGAELGVVGPRRVMPAPVAVEAPAPAPVDLAAEKAAAEKAAARALADKRAADRKAVADKKALAEKKAAAAKKAEEEREAAAQRKIERANPERIWVQVAGGANEHDLHKAWAAAKAKGGDAFAGHASGWTTPLRFTNRVLAGPFKTGEEARAFVNKLKGAGMSTFTFTSEAGQVVTKLSSE